MKITYDPEADAVYIKFKSKMFRTEHWSDSIAADYDVAGHLVGIEFLDASQHFSDLSQLKTLEFEQYPTR
jgi:uncharacterized protein YuzE